MLRGLSSSKYFLVGTSRVLRPLTTTIRQDSLFKNFKEALKQESKAEGLDDQIRKLKQEADDDLRKFSESEKFKKLKK